MNDSMPAFQKIGNKGDIPVDTGRAFAVGDHMVAVFRDGDRFYAIDDFCPHMGASLAEGHVCEGAVACPWHAWRFCIQKGTWLDNPKIGVDTFEVQVRGEELWVATQPRPKN
jgi:nitrite reductase (NADH) small subunit/3-phenylpropionate/trans-cinnamate dioxygenase ferredoxin subunit